jgi:hypothetical protein
MKLESCSIEIQYFLHVSCHSYSNVLIFIFTLFLFDNPMGIAGMHRAPPLYFKKYGISEPELI